MAISQELGDTQLNSTPSTQKRTSKRKSSGATTPQPEQQPKRSKPNYPFGQMVTLQIGYNDETRFIVPKHFICAKSAFVRTAIEVPFEREGKIKDVVYLPELCPSGFQIYLNWVFRDQVDYTLLEGDGTDPDQGCKDELCSIEWRGNRKSKLTKRLHLYSMAAKLKDTALQNDIIDDLIAGDYHLQLDDTVVEDFLARAHGVIFPIVKWMAQVLAAKVGTEQFTGNTNLPSSFLYLVIERMKDHITDGAASFPSWDDRDDYHEEEGTV